jgi:hypothetical protein
LNREDGLIVFFDGDRLVSYVAGFGAHRASSRWWLSRSNGPCGT